LTPSYATVRIVDTNHEARSWVIQLVQVLCGC
jgi:hypothetical protein